MSYVYKPMHELSTPRTCAVCNIGSATHERYSMDKKGEKINRSSKVYVCVAHAEEKAA